MIVTPLDSAQLDSKQQYEFYHRMVDFSVKELIVKMQQQQLCAEQELVFLKQYCDLLLYSIEAMRVKYMYDDEDNMKIDLTDSGFPNYLEFRYLFNDLALREEYLNRLTDINVLQDEFLDTLMRKKEPIKKSRLFQAASIVYYTNVKQQFIFNRFVQGKILKSPKIEIAEYMTSWSFYDVSHNRPFVCFMYFNYDGRDPIKDKAEIYQAIKQSADRKMNLDAMAYAIDRKLPELLPKQLKRVDLGPLHNVFAKDENDITHTILDAISKKDIPVESYAFSLKIDEVSSTSEFKEGSFFSKQTFQRWGEIKKLKYVLAPHRIIQLLYNKTPEVIDKLAKPPIQVSDL
ncbi:hypothetical protein [Winogradskyella sp.]|uniref:hypothetical protein n=1 Tax=Winogradskyella sp. TaxID=1883156 RepID=UPI0035C7C96F